MTLSARRSPSFAQVFSSLSGKGGSDHDDSFQRGRPWGLPKTGGRQKGTPNKATLTVQEKLDSIGCDSIIELAKLGMNEKFTEEFRRRCFSDLASYICPKPKPADLTTTPE